MAIIDLSKIDLENGNSNKVFKFFYFLKNKNEKVFEFAKIIQTYLSNLLVS